MRRRTLRFATLAAVLVLVAAGYAALWLYFATMIADGIDRWADDRRAEGFRVSYGEPRITGFPLHFIATVEHPVIEGPAGAWLWSGPTIVSSAPVWDYRHVAARVPGKHMVSWRAERGTRSLTIEAPLVQGEVDIAADGRVAAGEVALGQIIVQQDTGEVLGVREARAELRRLPPEQPGAAGGADIGFKFDLRAATLPARYAGPLGPLIDSIELNGAVLGPLPAAPPRESLALWRDAGGTLEVTKLDLAWGTLVVSGDGTFALDPDLQPIGAMAATVRGHEELLAALTSRMPSGLGNLVRITGALLGAGRPEGARISLSLQDGYLWLGPVKLAEVPRIQWP